MVLADTNSSARRAGMSTETVGNRSDQAASAFGRGRWAQVRVEGTFACSTEWIRGPSREIAVVWLSSVSLPLSSFPRPASLTEGLLIWKLCKVAIPSPRPSSHPSEVSGPALESSTADSSLVMTPATGPAWGHRTNSRISGDGAGETRVQGELTSGEVESLLVSSQVPSNGVLSRCSSGLSVGAMDGPIVG